MLTIGDYQVDETKIPAAVSNKLLTRAISHIFFNECSARVLGQEKRAIVGKEGKPETVTDTMLESWRAINAEQIVAWESEFCSAKLSAIYEGTLSVRVSRGPVRDPMEATARAITKSEIVIVLKSNGLKFPAKDETINVGDVDVTGDELIDRRLAHPEHGARIRKLAERKVAEDKRLRDASMKQVAGETGGLAASLGL